MTSIDMTKPPADAPDPDDRENAAPAATPLDHLTRHRRPAKIDTAAPVLPLWVRDRETFTYLATQLARRHAHRAARWAVQAPALLALLVLYSPRGLGRLAAALGRWIYDKDTAGLRAHHAGQRETSEFKAVHGARRANLHARWLLAATVAALIGVPVLAWTAPGVLSGIVGVAVGAWIIKMIPGRGLDELGIAAAVALAIWWFGAGLLMLLPRPPMWPFVVAAVVCVLALGWHGRPRGQALVKGGDYATPGLPQKPTADMIIEALCRIGLPGMTPERIDRAHAEVRIIAPGVATSAHGYTVEFELPPGRTAEEVVGKRDKLAGALRRDLGCVWPSGNEDRHPGYTRLFLSHKPMNAATQPRWPLAACKPVDIFDPLPLFTDEQMKWVDLTLAGTHTAVGGASGFGKSVWLRQLTLAIAMDPRVRLVIIDGKRSGDFEHVRKVCHAFHEGAEDDEVAAQLDELRGLVAECLKRSKFLKGLPPEERSPKVTSALASKYAELRPIVFVYDEVQEGTEYGVKGQKPDMKIRQEYASLLTRLARIARSAGVFMVLASQKPDSGVIPSSIMGNCSIRVAFKVSEQVHNDQILGTSARKNGIDATMFGARDRGLAWVKGGDTAAAQVVRSWSEMVDMGLAVEMGDKVYEMRRAGGWLTGQAAGEVAEPESVDLAADVLKVLDDQGRDAMHLGELADCLAEMFPDRHPARDAAAMGAALRAVGIDVDDQVKVQGRNSSGVRRTAVER